MKPYTHPDLDIVREKARARISEAERDRNEPLFEAVVRAVWRAWTGPAAAPVPDEADKIAAAAIEGYRDLLFVAEEGEVTTASAITHDLVGACRSDREAERILAPSDPASTFWLAWRGQVPGIGLCNVNVLNEDPLTLRITKAEANDQRQSVRERADEIGEEWPHLNRHVVECVVESQGVDSPIGSVARTAELIDRVVTDGAAVTDDPLSLAFFGVEDVDAGNARSQIAIEHIDRDSRGWTFKILRHGRPSLELPRMRLRLISREETGGRLVAYIVQDDLKEEPAKQLISEERTTRMGAERYVAVLLAGEGWVRASRMVGALDAGRSGGVRRYSILVADSAIWAEFYRSNLGNEQVTVHLGCRQGPEEEHDDLAFGSFALAHEWAAGPSPVCCSECGRVLRPLACAVPGSGR